MIEEQNGNGNTVSARAASAEKVERAADALESVKVMNEEGEQSQLAPDVASVEEKVGHALKRAKSS